MVTIAVFAAFWPRIEGFSSLNPHFKRVCRVCRMCGGGKSGKDVATNGKVGGKNGNDRGKNGKGGKPKPHLQPRNPRREGARGQSPRGMTHSHLINRSLFDC
jgi:hypothetical protein